VFVQNCSACHQKTGLGIPGAFPALAGDPYVVGAPDPVILTLLNGRGGMPRFRDSLSDEQIAAAITYIRSTWGNHAPGVAAATVASARAASGSDAPRTGGQAH
jgi:mono/diheme cytochrome c family protein